MGFLKRAKPAGNRCTTWRHRPKMKAQTTKFVHFNFLIVFEESQGKKESKNSLFEVDSRWKKPKKLFLVVFLLKFLLNFTHEKKWSRRRGELIRQTRTKSKVLWFLFAKSWLKCAGSPQKTFVAFVLELKETKTWHFLLFNFNLKKVLRRF
jgi:hypothetical protein